MKQTTPFDVSSLLKDLPDASDQNTHDPVGPSPSAERTKRGHERIRDSLGSESITPSDDQTIPEARSVEAVAEDAINPAHYRRHPSGIECIEVTRHMNFNVGNAIKYLWRYMDKDDPIENLKKAQWYIDDEIRRLQGLR
jgi:hypothetical protein